MEINNKQPQIIKFHTIKSPFGIGHTDQTTTLSPTYEMLKLDSYGSEP